MYLGTYIRSSTPYVLRTPYPNNPGSKHYSLVWFHARRSLRGWAVSSCSRFSKSHGGGLMSHDASFSRYSLDNSSWGSSAGLIVIDDTYAVLRNWPRCSPFWKPLTIRPIPVYCVSICIFVCTRTHLPLCVMFFESLSSLNVSVASMPASTLPVSCHPSLS